MSGVLGDRVKISEGIVNSIAGIDNDPTMFQISIPIQPGNSGGPLITKQGFAVGVVTSRLNQHFLLETQNTFVENVNFAVKTSLLLNLKSLIPSYSPVSPTVIGQEDLNAKGVMATYKDAVVKIEAKK
jgi:S1-C subfamily serine protease